MKSHIGTIYAVVVLIPLTIVMVRSDDWVAVVPFVALILVLVSSDLRARWTYQEGWHRGRAEMFTSAAEAANRNMSPVEWLEAEAERTIKNRKGL
jgi:hypothetical protein